MAGNKVTDKCTCCSSFAEWCRCVEGVEPSLQSIKRIFTLLVQYLFSDKDRLAGLSDALACRTYSSNQAETGIHIAPATVVDPGDTEVVPAILIQASNDGVKFEKLAIDPSAHETPDYASNTEVWKCDAVLQFRCLDRDGDVAGLMADALMLFLTSLRRGLLERVPWLKEYVPVEITEPKMMKSDIDETSADKWYESIVAVQISYIYSVFVSTESKRLKDFSLYPGMRSGNITLDTNS